MTFHHHFPQWPSTRLPDEAEVCDPHVVGAVSEANDIHKLIQCPRYRSYLRNPDNMLMIEEAFDKLRSVLEVLNREDA